MLFFAHSVTEHYVRQVAMGILDSPEFQLNWRLRILAPPRTAVEMNRLLTEFSPAAVVIFRLQESLVTLLLKKEIPCVVVDADTHPWANIPVIEIDHLAVGHCAANYFLDLNYHHFAVARSSDRSLFIEREKGFIQRLKEHRQRCETFLMPGREDSLLRYQRPPSELSKWLTKLTKPCAIFATNDEAGLRIIDVCHQLSLRVPEEIAVLGVDNMVVICRSAFTPLSSINLPFEEQGRQVARLFCSKEHCAPVGRHVHRIAPSEVVSRASTVQLNPVDPVVKSAMQYIQQHINEPFHIQDLKSLTGVSTPTLSAKFKAELGYTPIEMVRRERINRSKRLLIESSLPVSEVATRSGFRSLERFCIVFRELVGQTPSQYRRSTRET